MLGLGGMGCGGEGPGSVTPRDASAAHQDLAEEGAQGGDMAVRVPRSFAEIDEIVLQPKCAAFPACHSVRGATGASKLDLETDPYLALVGVRAVQPQAAAEGLRRVSPCEPDTSFLWIKLDRFNPRYRDSDYGGPMPLDRPALPAVQKQAIRDWIARGAPRDEAPDGGTALCPPDAGAAPDAR